MCAHVSVDLEEEKIPLRDIPCTPSDIYSAWYLRISMLRLCKVPIVRPLRSLILVCNRRTWSRDQR